VYRERNYGHLILDLKDMHINKHPEIYKMATLQAFVLPFGLLAINNE
jgi:hypothetical protein